MAQCEPCVQILKKKKKKRKGIKKKGKSKKEGHILAANGRVRERREKRSFR